MAKKNSLKKEDKTREFNLQVKELNKLIDLTIQKNKNFPLLF
ncbi:MAG TPA: hypothetical protein VJG49_02860 [Candidatus Nanoarchaeia archaeon]|nr:hypothetical protein [Candidatus Nanoarchaeia archaeon]